MVPNKPKKRRTPESIAMGGRLKQARLAASDRLGFGKRVVDAARYFGLEINKWHTAENGWRPPSRKTLPLFANWLGVSEQYLLIGPDEALDTTSDVQDGSNQA